MKFVMKRGDLLPELVATLRDGGTKQPVDLSSATSITAVAAIGGGTLFSRAVTGNSEGEVTVPWEEGDTSIVGTINVEFLVTWPGSKPQTFPADGYIEVEVTENLTGLPFFAGDELYTLGGLIEDPDNPGYWIPA